MILFVVVVVVVGGVVFHHFLTNMFSWPHYSTILNTNHIGLNGAVRDVYRIGIGDLVTIIVEF
jgi:hypothetical protein